MQSGHRRGWTPRQHALRVATCQEPIVHTGVLRERKDPYDASSSSKVLACFRSSVSENGKYYAGYREALRNLQAAIKARDSG